MTRPGPDFDGRDLTDEEYAAFTAAMKGDPATACPSCGRPAVEPPPPPAECHPRAEEAS